MADLKISQLTGATTPLAGTEVLPVVQSGTTKNVSVANLTAGRNISVLNLAGTQTVGTSLGSGGVYLSGNGGPDTGFVGYNYKNISGTESVPEPARASWREGFLNGASVEWNVSYRAASAAVSSWTKYFGVGSTGDVTVSVGNLVIGTAGKGITDSTGATTMLFSATKVDLNKDLMFPNSTGIRGSGNNIIVMCPTTGIFYHQVGAGSYYTVTTSGGSTSDASLKKNVRQLSGALGKVCQLRGVNFEFIDPSLASSDQGDQIGVIAQEVEAQYPEIVITNEDGIKSVRYDRLVAPLIEAIKDLKAELDVVKAELAQLKSA